MFDTAVFSLGVEKYMYFNCQFCSNRHLSKEILDEIISTMSSLDELFKARRREGND